MSGPGEKRSAIFINLILIALVLILIFTLYKISGGDLLAWIRPGTYSSGNDPISQLVGSLRAFGQGLRDSFSGFLR
jgi:hypothetical protein